MYYTEGSDGFSNQWQGGQDSVNKLDQCGHANISVQLALRSQANTGTEYRKTIDFVGGASAEENLKRLKLTFDTLYYSIARDYRLTNWRNTQLLQQHGLIRKEEV